MNPVEDAKAKLRREIVMQRRQLQPAWVREMSDRIMKVVMDLDEFQRARLVGAYVALPKEVQTVPLFVRCWEMGKKLCVPAFDLDAGTYRMALLEKDVEMVPGPAGIMEPRVLSWVAPEQLEFMAVPALAFDLEGFRLGHGGGHYDRILGRSRAFKAGVVFDFQVVERLPHEPHDQKVTLIVTEARVVRCHHRLGEEERNE